MEGSKGLPVGIQVSTMPYQDEKCIGAMRILEKLIHFDKIPLEKPLN